MRDPARIDRMLALLREAWMAAPDWRLGQLVSNAVADGGGNGVFYAEDDVMESGLRTLLAELKP